MLLWLAKFWQVAKTSLKKEHFFVHLAYTCQHLYYKTDSFVFTGSCKNSKIKPVRYHFYETKPLKKKPVRVTLFLICASMFNIKIKRFWFYPPERFLGDPQESPDHTLRKKHYLKSKPGSLSLPPSSRRSPSSSQQKAATLPLLNPRDEAFH